MKQNSSQKPPKQTGDGDKLLIYYDEAAELPDDFFKFKWWSPIFLWKYYVTKKHVKRYMDDITKNIPKPRIQP